MSQFTTPTPSVKRVYPFGGDEQRFTATSITIPSQPRGDHEFICFGSIVDVNAQVHSPVHIYNAWSRTQSFTVTKEGDYFSLERNGYKFARLEKVISRGLLALVTGRNVLIKAHASNENSNAALRSQRVPIDLLIEINIYGRRADAEPVGSILSKSGIFLQLPRYRLDGVAYYNPHVLRMEGYLDEALTNTPSIQDAVEAPDQSVQEDTQQNDSVEVEGILDSLSHHSMLREVHVDAHHIKSPLLPHQKEAIDFIFTREAGDVASKLSLWGRNDLDADEPFYQHVFSGAKRPKPDEARGGIIADEMGLGKSLVILSAVAGSLDRAEELFATTQHSTKTASKATLILAPSSLLIDNWVDEIRKHTYPGALSFHKHLGSQRRKETDLLLKRVIVFTTYATVATEFSRGDKTLSKIHWFRIVLDEAHDIRNRSTKQFQAVASLSAQHRWCLTGTPIQNSLEDLSALASFLKVPILENAPTFRKFITNPIASTSRGPSRFQNLRILLQTICLRRTRELLHLPEPDSRIRRLSFTPTEREEYNKLIAQCKMEIDRAVSVHRKSKINSKVLESLLKLRLFCNHGNANNALDAGPTSLPADPDEALSYLQQNNDNVCAYCSGTIYFINDAEGTGGAIFMSSCCHLVCPNCIPDHHAQRKRCPTCATRNGSTIPAISPLNDMQTQSLRASGSSVSLSSGQRYPSKLRALLCDLRDNSTQKSIVFSCWKKTLELVGELLSKHAVPYVVINGSHSLNERIKVLQNFRSPLGANILLMTLGTGATGLNLAVASRVYLLEPQWNPSIESQAIGRAQRLGQTAQVVIVRYIMEKTVEESNVLSRQRKKLDLAVDGFSKKKDMSLEERNSLLDVFGVDKASLS